jgi:hypothetical protein
VLSLMTRARRRHSTAPRSRSWDIGCPRTPQYTDQQPTGVSRPLPNASEPQARMPTRLYSFFELPAIQRQYSHGLACGESFAKAHATAGKPSDVADAVTC